MSWGLRVRHTRVSYNGEAHASYRPHSRHGSRRGDHGVAVLGLLGQPGQCVRPAATAHGLVVNAVSTVEADAPALPEPPAWAEIIAQGRRGLYEWLQPTPLTTVTPELLSLAREAVAGADPHEAAAALGAWARDSVECVPGSRACRPARRTPGTCARASARTWRTSPSRCCAGWACRHGTAPAHHCCALLTRAWRGLETG
jgi:hypothetical protein